MNRVHPEKFSDTDEHARRGVSAEELQTLKDLLKRLLQEGDDPDEDDSKVARDERNVNEDAELEAEQPPSWFSLHNTIGHKRFSFVSNTFLMMSGRVGQKEAKGEC